MKLLRVGELGKEMPAILDSNNEIRNFLLKEDIKFTFTSDNVGLCTAINTVARKASKSYLIYSHDDM